MGLIPLDRLTSSRVFSDLSGAEKLKAYDAWTEQALQEARRKGLSDEALKIVEARLKQQRGEYTGSVITSTRRGVANTRAGIATTRAGSEAEFQQLEQRTFEGLQKSLKPGEAIYEGGSLSAPRGARLIDDGVGRGSLIFAVPEGTEGSVSLEEWGKGMQTRKAESTERMATQLANAQEQAENAAQLPVSPGMQEFLEAEGFRDSSVALFKNFGPIVANAIFESAPSLAGAVAGGAVAGPGGAVAGSVGPEFTASYREALTEFGQEAGIDTSTPEGLARAMQDEEINGKALQRAGTRAGIISAVSGIQAKLASKVIGKLGPQTFKEVGKATVLGSVAEGGGEGLAQYASGQDFAPKDVVLETLAGGGEMVAQVAQVATKKFLSPDAEVGQTYKDEDGVTRKIVKVENEIQGETGKRERVATSVPVNLASRIPGNSLQEVNQKAKELGAPTLASESTLETLRSVNGDPDAKYNGASASSLKKAGYIEDTESGKGKERYRVTELGRALLGTPEPEPFKGDLIPGQDSRGVLKDALQGPLKLGEQEADATATTMDALVRAVDDASGDTSVTRIEQVDSVPGGEGVIPDNQLPQYAGESANMPEMQRTAMATAQAMAESGKTDEEIRGVTGWFRGKYDGKWRWEIPDNEAKWRDPIIDRYRAGRKRLGDDKVPMNWFFTIDTPNGERLSSFNLQDVIDHPALFTAYPQARFIKVRFGDTGGARGDFNPETGAITFSNNRELSARDGMSTLLHEIQHWIQGKEGFATGGNMEQFPPAQTVTDAQVIRSRIDRGMSPTQAADWFEKTLGRKPGHQAMVLAGEPKQKLRLLSGGDRESYKRVAGEIEARDIQTRASLTPEQRRTTEPYSSEEIAPEDAIVNFRTDITQESSPTSNIPQFRQIARETGTPETEKLDTLRQSGKIRSLLYRMDDVIDEAESKNQVGEEHYVIDDPNNPDRVLKVAKAGYGKGANNMMSLDGYLEKLDNSNRALGTDFRVEGVIEGGEVGPNLVVSQSKGDKANRETDFVPWAQTVTRDLQSKGFTQVAPETWENESYRIDDVNPRNVWAVNGEPVYLDVQVEGKGGAGVLGQSDTRASQTNPYKGADLSYLRKRVRDFVNSAKGRELGWEQAENPNAARKELYSQLLPYAVKAATDHVGKRDYRLRGQPLADYGVALGKEINNNLADYVDNPPKTEENTTDDTENRESPEQLGSRETRGTPDNRGVDSEGTEMGAGPWARPLGNGGGISGPLGTVIGDGSLQPTTGAEYRIQQLRAWIRGQDILDADGNPVGVENQHSFRDFFFWLGENPFWVLDAEDIAYYEPLLGRDDVSEAGLLVQRTMAQSMGQVANLATTVKTESDNFKAGQDVDLETNRFLIEQSLLLAQRELLEWLHQRTPPRPERRGYEPPLNEQPEPDTLYRILTTPKPSKPQGPLNILLDNPEPSVTVDDIVPPNEPIPVERWSQEQVIKGLQFIEDLYAGRFPGGREFVKAINREIENPIDPRAQFRWLLALGVGNEAKFRKQAQGILGNRGQVKIRPFSGTPYQEHIRYPSLKRVIRDAYKKGKTNRDILLIGQHIFKSLNLVNQDKGGNPDILGQDQESQPDTSNWKGYYDRGARLIGLLPNADASTLAHEIFHMARRKLQGTKYGDALNEYYQTNGDNWTRDQDEAFARHGERYLYDGKTPADATPAFRKAMRRVANVARRIYNVLKGEKSVLPDDSPIIDQVPPEVRKVLDELFTRGSFLQQEQTERIKSAAVVNENNPQRIPIKPEEGEVKKNREVLFNAGRDLGETVRYGTEEPGTFGTYSTDSSLVSIKYAGDLDTTAHELGHAIDDRLGLGIEIENRGLEDAIDQELLKPEFQATTQETDDPMVKRTEGLAEFVRGLMVNPDATREAAPQLSGLFDELIEPSTMRGIQKFGKAVRAWEAAPASEKLLANVEEGVAGKFRTWLNWFRGTDKANQEGFVVTGRDKLAAEWLDDKHPLMKAVDYVEKENGETLLPEDDPRVLARLLQGVGSKEQEVLESGMIDTQFNRVLPGGIEWLMEPFGRQPGKQLQKDFRDAIALMIAERTVELSERFGRDDVLTGAGAGVITDLKVAQDTISQLEQDGERYARLKEAGERYRQWGDANLKYLRDKGRISNTAYKEITENNQHYVALNRIMEVAPGEELQALSFGAGKNLGSAKEVIHKLKGSARTIKNPYISLLESSSRIIGEADRNEVMASFVEMLETGRTLYGEPENRFASIAVKVDQRKKQPKNTVTVYRKGKKEVWQITDENVYNALKGLGKMQGLSGDWKLLGVPARVLKFGITNMPAFAVKNLIRDTQSRFLVSRSTVQDALKSTLPQKDRKKLLEMLKLGGGDQAGFYTRDQSNYLTSLTRALSDLSTDRNSLVMTRDQLARFFGANGPYRRMLERAEQSNRLAEYRAAYKEGKRRGYDDFNAHLYANSQARDLMDFAVAGHKARVINSIVPFFNAAIQGSTRNVIAAMENPGRYAMRFALFALVPTLLHRALITAQGEEVEDEYEEMPSYLRDMFWNFKVAPNLWLRIPKSFESGVLASYADRIWGKLRGYEDALDGFGTSMYRAFVPVDETTILGPAKPIVEAMTNHDMFRDKEIVSPYVVKRDLDARKKDGSLYHDPQRASRLGQAWQKMGEVAGQSETKFGRQFMDAKMGDFLARGIFGEMGSAAVRLSNTGRADTASKIGLKDIGLFVNSPAYGSRVVQDVYSLAERNGLERSSMMNNLEDLFTRYFNSRDNRQRDQLAKQIREEARRLKPELEREIQARKKRAQ